MAGNVLVTKDLIWDASWTKENGAPVPVPENQIPHLKIIFEKVFHQHQSKDFIFSNIRFKKDLDGSKLIVTLVFKSELSIENTRKIIEEWIASCLKDERDIRIKLYFERAKGGIVNDKKLDAEKCKTHENPTDPTSTQKQLTMGKSSSLHKNDCGCEQTSEKTPTNTIDLPQTPALTYIDNKGGSPEDILAENPFSYLVIEWTLNTWNIKELPQEELKRCRETLVKCVEKKLLPGQFLEIELHEEKLSITFQTENASYAQIVPTLISSVERCVRCNTFPFCWIHYEKNVPSIEEEGFATDHTLESSSKTSTGHCNLTPRNKESYDAHDRIETEEHTVEWKPPFIYIFIEWGLRFGDILIHEVDNIRKTLLKNVNEKFSKNKEKNICIANQHWINVTKEKLSMKFVVRKTCCIPTLDVFTDIVRTCLDINWNRHEKPTQRKPEQEITSEKNEQLGLDECSADKCQRSSSTQSSTVMQACPSGVPSVNQLKAIHTPYKTESGKPSPWHKTVFLLSFEWTIESRLDRKKTKLCIETLRQCLKKYLSTMGHIYIKEFTGVIVTNEKLKISLTGKTASSFPRMHDLEKSISKCLTDIKGISLTNGRQLPIQEMAISDKGFEMTLFLFIPEDMESQIQTVEVLFGAQEKTKTLLKDGKIWKNIIYITDEDVILKDQIAYVCYKYVLTYKKSMFGNWTKGSYEEPQRKTSLVDTQKDIISRKYSYLRDIIKGTIVHLEHNFNLISEYAPQKTLHDFDNFASQNTTDLNQEINQLLKNNLTEGTCLLLLHSIRKRYFTISDEKNASKIVNMLQSFNLSINCVFAEFAPEILQIYKTSLSSKYFLVHFMVEMRFVLNVSGMRIVLLSESAVNICNCKHASQCLEQFLRSILERNADLETLQDIICIIFDKIPKHEVLRGLGILEKELKAKTTLDKQDDFRNRVFQTMSTYLTENIQSHQMVVLKEFFPKAKLDEIGHRYISHCEKEIASMIANSKFDEAFLKNIEDLCQDYSFFKDEDQQLLLLSALLKTLCIKSKNNIRYIITRGKSANSRIAMLFEKKCDVLLKEGKLMESLVICDVLSGLDYFKGDRESFQGKLLIHVSKIPTADLFSIHLEIENLKDETVDFYGQLLKENLKSETLDNMCIYIEENGSEIISRGMAEVFIASLESYEGHTSADTFSMGEKFTFWKNVLCVEGKYSHLIKRHSVFSEIKERFTNMFQDIQRETCNNATLQKMNLNIENVAKFVDIFVFVVDETESVIWDSLKKAVAFVETASNDIVFMTSVLSGLPSIVHGTFLNKSLRHLEDMKANLENGKMTFKEFRNQEIFIEREFQYEKCLLQSCKEIKRFLDVKSFWQALDMNEMQKQIDEKQKNFCKLNQNCQTKIFLGFLATECITKFKNEMQNVFHNDIPISRLHQLFQRKPLIMSDLCKELCHIEKIIGLEVQCYERETTIKRCLDFSLISKKTDALRKIKTCMRLKIDEECETQLKKFEEIRKCPEKSEWSMLNTDALIKQIESEIVNFSEKTIAVINQLSESQNLVSFLGEIKNEDTRNLIDAVEGEYFDQYLPLVSHLVDVQELLLPILEKTETREYIKAIEDSIESTKIEKVIYKIAHCSQELDSLKSFYKTFANKSEKTKERITNILEEGCFQFKSAGEDCRMELSYIGSTNLSASELSDMRSRVLLLQNKFENIYLRNASGSLTQSFSKFLKKIDDAAEILEIFKQLQISGYPLFRNFEMSDLKGRKQLDVKIEVGDLEERKHSLLKSCNEWRNDLNEFRQQYFCMRYIKSEHLPILFNYIESNDDERKTQTLVKSILYFLHPGLELIVNRDTFSEGPRGYLEMLARALEKRFNSLALCKKTFPESKKHHHLHGTLSKNLYFLCIDKQRRNGLNVLLGLFRTKCNTLPLPNQVVICNENTSWDEIYLLLLRWKKDEKEPRQCFCLAFLELIPIEYQRKLVEEIKKADWKNNSLALIYRGRSTDSIPTFFSDYEIFVNPLDKTEIENLLQTMFPDVKVFTSDLPGLGKTEEIQDWAASRGKGVKSLHISGTYQKSELLRILTKLDLKSDEILLIEIGQTDKPWELDIFFFELLILNYVSFSSLSYVLPNTPIAIEVTNCPNQLIPNSLPFLMSFSRKHLTWEDYDNYKCQQVQNSPIQVQPAEKIFSKHVFSK
uniref:Uncharacterized protein LOC111128905 isoform X2 n=1 Tax=Crassostrea virginica TaxID=6565 RepID=A0A8B8DQQ4_CRAVI|nr:uncharacterized protein LOC111128905 isoform X2 [Crassostrea virginica]